MQWTGARRNLWSVAFAGLLAANCSSSTENKTPRIELSVPNAAATIAQSGSASIPVSVTRKNFTGTVTLTVEGAPAGITANATPASLDNGVASSTISIAASSTANPGSVTLTVRAKGDGITEQAATINLTVTVTGTFALGVLNSSLTVAQGGGGNQTILVPRSGNNAGNVTLVASGVPAGATSTFAPAPTTGSTATMIVAASASTASGTYTVTVTGSSPGLTDQTTTFSLVVVAPPSTANISIPFCAGDFPIWFAYQNEGFNWQQVPATGTAFNFGATPRLTVAFTYQSGSDFQINIFNITRAELAASNDRDCLGSKTLSGTIANVSADKSVKVVMGAASSTVTVIANPTLSYTLQQVNARPLDLVATRGVVSGNFMTPDRMIVRRSVDLTSGATIPALDFSAAESFAPAATNLTITGLAAADQVELTNTFWSATSTFGAAHTAQVTGGATTLYSVPGAQQVAGDLHELYVDAFQQSSSLVTGYSYVVYFSTTGDRTDAMGPSLNSPTLSQVTSSPYVRMRGQLTAQSQYNSSVRFGYFQAAASGGSRFVVLGSSAGYLGATPTTWDVLIPDFTGTTGFNVSWMLGAGQQTNYFTEAFSGRTELLFGALPVQGDLVKIGYRVAATTTGLAQFRSTGILPQVRATGIRARSLPQYLRR